MGSTFWSPRSILAYKTHCWGFKTMRLKNKLHRKKWKKFTYFLLKNRFLKILSGNTAPGTLRKPSRFLALWLVSFQKSFQTIRKVESSHEWYQTSPSLKSVNEITSESFQHSKKVYIINRGGGAPWSFHFQNCCEKLVLLIIS